MKRLIVVLAACGGASDPVAPSAGSDCPPGPVAKLSPAPPLPNAATAGVRLLVRSHVVDGDGKVVATVAGPERYDAALPVGGDRFSIGAFIADAGAAKAQRLPAIYDPGEGAYAVGGSFLIAAPLHGELQRVDLTAPPFGGAAGRAPVATGDAATGKVQWRVHASPHELTIAGDRVIASECAPDGARQWSTGYALADGAMLFVTPTQPGCDERLVAQDYVVNRPWSARRSTVYALAASRSFVVDGEVAAIAQVEADAIVLTDRDITRMTPSGAMVWRIAIDKIAFGDAGSITPIAGGDLVIELHDSIADSGLAFWRLHPDGRVVWQTSAAGIGVAHSKYSNIAYSTIRGDKLYAVSQASGGDFFERIDLATGADELRCQPIGDCGTLAERDARVPFVVGNDLVAPDGHVIHSIAGVERSAVARSFGGPEYIVGDVVVDAARDVTYRVTVVDPSQVAAFHIDHVDGESIVRDRSKREVLRLREVVAAAHWVDRDLVVVSDKRIARLAAGKPVWTLPPPADTFAAASELVELPGGDVVIATYCAISDDGIDLQRVGVDGHVRWHITVRGLGVKHSEYEQSVYLAVRGDAVFVVSQASGGDFVERVELATGAHRSVIRP